MKHDPSFVGITNDHRAEIEAVIGDLWNVISVEHTTHRLSFRINPNTARSPRARYDAEGEMMRRFGNAPYIFATDFNNYRLTFIADR